MIEMIMSPNSELSMLISVWKVSGQGRGVLDGIGVGLRILYWGTGIYTQAI